jgi:hypothetical protein
MLGAIVRAERVRLNEGLQRTSEVEDFTSIEVDKDYATACQRTPFNSSVRCEAGQDTSKAAHLTRIRHLSRNLRSKVVFLLST